MFAIKRNNIYLKFKNDAIFSTTIYSQLINENKLKGAITISLEIPIEGNEEFLGGIEQIKLINAGKKLKAGIDDVKVYLHSIWILYGKIMILRVNEDTLSGNLVVGLPGISSLDDKLQDLDWDIIALPTDPDIDVEMAAKLAVFNARQASDIWDPTDSSKSFNFPMIKNSIFYGNENAKNPDYQGYMNNFHGFGIDATFTANKYFNYNAIVPMVYQLEILRKGFLKGGYVFKWNELPGNEYIKLVAPNNYELAKIRPSLAVEAECTNDFLIYTTSGAEPFHPDNDSTGGNFDQNNLYDNVHGKYVIPRAGKYRIEYRIELDLGTIPSGYLHEFRSKLELNGINIESNYADYDSSSIAPYMFGQRIYKDFTEDDIGGELQLKLEYWPLGIAPNDPQVAKAGAKIFIRCISTPTLNVFADEIDLSKCVPQDILFRDYVNAFAATWNIRFDIDEYKKLIIARVNEDAIAAEPVHAESLWQSNSEPGIVELRNAKVKTFGYDFSVNDSAIGTIEDVHSNPLFIGYYPFFKDLQTNRPPSALELDKIVLVANENAFYRCERNPNFDYTVYFDQEYIWAFYRHNYFPVTINPEGSDFKLPMAPLMMTHKSFGHYAIGPYLALPWWEIEGNTPSFGLNVKDVGFRSIFYYGPDVGVYTIAPNDWGYPYATPLNPGDRQESWSNQRLTQKLRIDDPVLNAPSIIEWNWKATLGVMNTIRMVTKKLNLRIDEIIGWMFTQRMYVNGMVVMPEQLTITTRRDSEDIEIEGEFGIEEVELP